MSRFFAVIRFPETYAQDQALHNHTHAIGGACVYELLVRFERDRGAVEKCQREIAQAT